MSTVIDRDAGLTLVVFPEPEEASAAAEEDDVLTPGGHQRDERDRGVDGAQQFPGHEHSLTVEGAGLSRSPIASSTIYV